MTVRSIAQAAAGYVASVDYWDITTATYSGSPVNWYYLNTTFGEDTFFKPDGTRFYIVHRFSSGQVRQYDLSTAWELGTASPAGVVSVSAQDLNSMTGLYFKPDGTKFYTVGYGSDAVHEYDMSTAWDVTTASHNQSLSVSAQVTTPVGVFMRDNGSRLFVADYQYVRWYNLSTAWDISTATYSSRGNIYTSPFESGLRGFYWKDDGSAFYTAGYNADTLKYYTSSTWSPGFPSYQSSFSLDISKIEGSSRGICFGDSGSKVFISGYENDAILRFDLSTAWRPSTASFAAPTSDFLDVRNTDTTPVDIFLKPDGTELYMYGNQTNKIHQWNLSTPWDLSTKIYRGGWIAGTATAFTGFYIGDSGSKAYLTRPSDTLIYTYGMSVPWDASSIYNALITFDVSPWGTDPRDVTFSADGYKMYVLDGSLKRITEFSLSTAWNVSTASATGNILGVTQAYYPRGLYFGNDGYQIFVVDEYYNRVAQWDLTSPWDLSTASYSSLNSSIGAYFKKGQGVHLKDDDGTKLYVLTQDLKFILSFDMG